MARVVLVVAAMWIILPVLLCATAVVLMWLPIDEHNLPPESGRAPRG